MCIVIALLGLCVACYGTYETNVYQDVCDIDVSLEHTNDNDFSYDEDLEIECDIELLRGKFMELFEGVEHQLEAFVSAWQESEFLNGLDWFTIRFADERAPRGYNRSYGRLGLILYNGEPIGGRFSDQPFIDYFEYSVKFRELMLELDYEGFFYSINFRIQTIGDRTTTSLNFGILRGQTEFFYEIRPTAIPHLTSAFRFSYLSKSTERSDILDLNPRWQILMPPCRSIM